MYPLAGLGAQVPVRPRHGDVGRPNWLRGTDGEPVGTYQLIDLMSGWSPAGVAAEAITPVMELAYVWLRTEVVTPSADQGRGRHHP